VAGTNVFDVQITRDDLGRITQRIETVDGITRVFEYGYDLAGRLWQVGRNGDLVVRYTYDSNGNRIAAVGEAGTVAATYDDQDRLLTYNGATYTYTANGELATRTVGGATTSYVYDTLGSLMQVTKPNGDVITYTVDGRGRRVGKSVNGVRLKGWLYADQLRPIAELDGNGDIVSRFVYGARVNVPEYVIKNGERYRIFSDHLGTPRVVVHATTGVVVQRLDVQPFGEIIQDSSPGWQPFGFAGGLYDPDTGLVRFGVRDYDQQVGRWIAKDPIDFAGLDTNLYSYALGDPVNRLDQDGFEFAQALASVGAGVGGGFAAAGSLVIDAATGGVNVLATPGEIAAGAAIGAALGGSVGAFIDWMNAGGAVILAQNTKSLVNKVRGLLNTASGHASLCQLSPPEDPNQGHWRTEAKAALDRAKRLADRLPTKLREQVLSRIRSIEGLL